MTHRPRPRATALPFLLLGLIAGSASPTLATPAAKPPAPAAPPQADAGDLPVVEGGRATGQKTAEAARHDGLTVLDLSDEWLPSIFSETPDKPEPLRPFLIDLANGKFRSGSKYSRAREDRYFEAFGIPPSLNLLRRRIAERGRHACHARVKDGALEQLPEKNVIPAEEAEKVPNPALAPGEKPTEDKPSMIYTGKTVSPRPLTELEHRAVVAMQAHLRCEDLLSAKANAGRMDRRTEDGLRMYQRLQMVGDSGNIDLDTRTALLGDSREQDFLALLRALRERVVDATGLIEDGTAGDGPEDILGRQLDPDVMRQARGHDKPLPDAAPDLISQATTIAAKELGWTDSAAVAAWLARHPQGTRIAMTLPAAPAYHATHMALSVKIDRGDVWYDEQPTPRIIEKRPTFVLYADDHGTARPLVRWPTTIGGWADVSTGGGGIVQKWKESDVGPRVWRDLYVAPTWLPPGSTPDRDLVKWVSAGKWDLKRSIMGPGPHAAFGIVLLPHYKVVPTPKGDTFVDNGIGTHGSAVVTSILNGTSHGCHRLYNQLAVRLGSFLLQHRDHATRGQKPEYYRRTVHYMGTFQANIDTRGFLYELTPPVPVDVLPGNIRSARQVPPSAFAPANP